MIKWNTLTVKKVKYNENTIKDDITAIFMMPLGMALPSTLTLLSGTSINTTIKLFLCIYSFMFVLLTLTVIESRINADEYYQIDVELNIDSKISQILVESNRKQSYFEDELIGKFSKDKTNFYLKDKNLFIKTYICPINYNKFNDIESFKEELKEFIDYEIKYRKNYFNVQKEEEINNLLKIEEKSKLQKLISKN